MSGIMFASCNDKLNDNYTIKRYFKDEKTGICYSYMYLRSDVSTYPISSSVPCDSLKKEKVEIIK